MEIIPGLYQLKVPIPESPIGYVLPYLIETHGGYTIIDPGWNADESVMSLKRQLGDLGLSFRDIRRVIVTHIHADHYGMAGRIRQECGAEVITQPEVGIALGEGGPGDAGGVIGNGGEGCRVQRHGRLLSRRRSPDRVSGGTSMLVVPRVVHPPDDHPMGCCSHS